MYNNLHIILLIFGKIWSKGSNFTSFLLVEVFAEVADGNTEALSIKSCQPRQKNCWGKMYFHIVTSAFYLPRQKVLKFEGCTIFSENAKAHQIWIDENLVYLIKPYLAHILLIFFLILFIVILFRWGTNLCMSLFPSVRLSVVHHISGTVHQMTITVTRVTYHI